MNTTEVTLQNFSLFLIKVHKQDDDTEDKRTTYLLIDVN